jgi:hypothetical protein
MNGRPVRSEFRRPMDQGWTLHVLPSRQATHKRRTGGYQLSMQVRSNAEELYRAGRPEVSKRSSEEPRRRDRRRSAHPTMTAAKRISTPRTVHASSGGSPRTLADTVTRPPSVTAPPGARANSCLPGGVGRAAKRSGVGPEKDSGHGSCVQRSGSILRRTRSRKVCGTERRLNAYDSLSHINLRGRRGSHRACAPPPARRFPSA